MTHELRTEVTSLYHRLIEAWNDHDASAMAAQYADDGVQIGFDGSTATGPDEVIEHIAPIFESHLTAPYVTKVTDVRALGDKAAILFAIAGMVPPGQTELVPAANAHQSLVAARTADGWRVELFQNTPARFDGRPELVEQMTAELEAVRRTGNQHG